jgi:hypothetical protein
MDATKCCEHPVESYAKPESDDESLVHGVCANCGHDHGLMTSEKVAELFQAFRQEDK